jgi:hypothetical protein
MCAKSPFEEIVKEDFNQYRDISKRFRNISMTDIEGLHELTIDSWLLATRWSEIQSNAVKIATEYDVNKTDFSTWAYQKYRQLQELHITARGWHRQAKEEFKANCIMEG